MKRILSLYIVREIAALFVLGLVVFTLVLLMGRMIKLTDMVITHGVPLLDVGWMIIYLMPSFLVYTVPMAFLLAVLLSFGRLSADNEFTVMKACGISLVQIMPPVLLCGFVACAMGLFAGVVGVPWGNQSFSSKSFAVLRQNISATIREKVFWDDIPGVVLYTEHYDEERHTLSGVIIYDGRDSTRPLTIFAKNGVVGGGANEREIQLVLRNGSIHAKGKEQEYRLINFGEYSMTISAPGSANSSNRSPLDMDNAELRRLIDNPATPRQVGLKMAKELHSRYALPFASIVFAILAVPLGLQNRRSAKSSGFAISIGVLLLYYILFSLMGTLAEKGTFSMALALWLPNAIFFVLGWLLLRMVSLERTIPVPSPELLLRLFRKVP
ncbi:MAG: LPS export ABC transporter permease LptF [Desulfuromonadales bacterium]|nr:LPS export ABC transporter permease LptF [Desulfuromonadales bacterium]